LSAKSDYFEQTVPLFGEAVEKAFPSAVYDIEEAGKCLALQRSTACVVHLMRVLEIGLNRLAAQFGVPFENVNWQNVIDQIEVKIRNINSVSNGANWKVDEQYYSEAAAHFRFLKNAWRNHAMHVREQYDEPRAEVILNNVRAVMTHLATHLSETS
jgi:hypothetical protein